MDNLAAINTRHAVFHHHSYAQDYGHSNSYISFVA